MTEQYAAEFINSGPDPSYIFSNALNAGDQQGSDASNDTVFFFDPITISSAAHFTATSSATLGTVIAVLQPGVYIATLVGSIAGAAKSLAISVGGAVNSFGTTPAAIGGASNVIALASNLAANDSVVEVSTSFRINPEDLATGSITNQVRFLGDASGVWVATTVRMRIDRVTAG